MQINTTISLTPEQEFEIFQKILKKVLHEVQLTTDTLSPKVKVSRKSKNPYMIPALAGDEPLDPTKPMTIKQASRYIGMSEWTLRTYTRKGNAPHYRQGRKYMYRPQEIMEWYKTGPEYPKENASPTVLPTSQLGEQWVRVIDMSYFYAAETDHQQDTIELVFKPLWSEKKIIKKYIQEEDRLIAVDILSNLELEYTGTFLDKYMAMKKAILNKQVLVEVLNSGNRRYPLSASTPLAVRETE